MRHFSIPFTPSTCGAMARMELTTSGGAEASITSPNAPRNRCSRLKAITEHALKAAQSSALSKPGAHNFAFDEIMEERACRFRQAKLDPEDLHRNCRHGSISDWDRHDCTAGPSLHCHSPRSGDPGHRIPVGSPMVGKGAWFFKWRSIKCNSFVRLNHRDWMVAFVPILTCAEARGREWQGQCLPTFARRMVP